jgi:pimeloyl-ACP methyl ester carboxylesterase
VLLLCGDHDRLVPPAYGEAYRKHIPHAEIKLISNCGHLPMFEQETAFVKTIVEFCK